MAYTKNISRKIQSTANIIFIVDLECRGAYISPL